MHTLSDGFFFFNFRIQNSPITHWVWIHFAPPSIWISNTNKSHLFGFVWAPPRCERKVGGTGLWILELLSQNIDGTEPVPVTPQPKTHVNVPHVTSWQHRDFYLFREEADWAWSTSSFSAPPSCAYSFIGTPGRWVGGHCTAPTWTIGGAGVLFKAMLMIIELVLGTSFKPPVSAALHLTNN